VFKFMASSLKSLLDNIKSHQNLRKYFQGEQLELLRQKGIYPYEHSDSVERFDKIELPPKDALYSQLNECGTSDKDHEHAQKVWEVFRCKTLHDYHKLNSKITTNGSLEVVYQVLCADKE
jgi:hypothetical protein